MEMPISAPRPNSPPSVKRVEAVSYTHLLRQLCVLLPVAYLFAKIGGLTWIWWSLPLAECVALIICLLFMLRIYRKVIRHVPDNP